MLLLSHFFFLLLSLCLLLYQDSGKYVVLIAISFAIIEITLWAIRDKMNGVLNWCSPIPIFVLGFCIVFYQLPFCYLFDFELSHHSKYILFAPANIPYCVALAASGLAAFFCGEQCYWLYHEFVAASPKIYGSPFPWAKKKILGKQENIQTQTRGQSSITGSSDRGRGQVVAYSSKHHSLKVAAGSSSFRVTTVTLIVILFSCIFFLLYLLGIGGLHNFFGYDYGNVRATRFASHFQLAYTVLMYTAILLGIGRLIPIRINSIREYIQAWDKKTLFLIGVTLIPPLLSGDRGVVLQVLALVVAPYFLLVRPLGIVKAVFAIIIGALCLSIIGDIRGRSEELTQSAFTSYAKSIANPAEWPTMELANSFGTFNIATVYFPKRYEYNLGENALYKILGLVPFSSVVTNIRTKNYENDYIYTSSAFFTNILTRGTFSSGAGSSSLADIYLDFGPYGIPPVLFLWGLFMAWIIQRATLINSEIFIFLYAHYCYFGLYVNRSSFYFGWNRFIWVIVLYYCIKHFYLNRSPVANGQSTSFSHDCSLSSSREA